MKLSAVVVACVIAFGGITHVQGEEGGTNRPFVALIDGHANPVPTEDPCVLFNTEFAQVKASHLGNATWESTETANFCTNPEGVDVVGEFTLTAANGDKVFGTYTTLLHPNFETQTLSASGQYVVTGGTGRFDGATGGGLIVATGSLAPPFGVTGAMNGTISY
jgi:hypothetical protein